MSQSVMSEKQKSIARTKKGSSVSGESRKLSKVEISLLPSSGKYSPAKTHVSDAVQKTFGVDSISSTPDKSINDQENATLGKRDLGEFLDEICNVPRRKFGVEIKESDPEGYCGVTKLQMVEGDPENDCEDIKLQMVEDGPRNRSKNSSVIANDALERELAEEDLLDIDFDSVSQMMNQSTDPLEYFTYNRVKLDNRFTACAPPEFDLEPPQMELYAMGMTMKQILEFVTKSEEHKTSNNKHGYHVIIGADALQRFFSRNRDLEMVAGSSTLVTMFGGEQTLKSRGLMMHIQRFLTWLTFVSSPGFTRMYKKILEQEIEHRTNQLMQDKIDVQTDHVLQMLESKMKVQIVLSPSHSYLWSMEGASKFTSPDTLKYLHFHLIICHNASINEKRFNFVESALKKVFESDITIRGLMSHYQILYIFKERFCVGLTKVTTPIPGHASAKLVSIKCWNTTPEFFADLIERVGTFGIRNGNIGAVCVLCNQVPESARNLLGCRYGWDYKLTTNLFDSEDPEFLSAFKSVKDYEKYVSHQQEYAGFCTMKLRSMVSLRSTMLSNYFAMYGVDPDETAICVNMILRSFNAFIGSLNDRQRLLYDQIIAWITTNILNSDSSTWKSILVLGGKGGSGKTTVATYLMRAIGARVISHTFDVKNPGREALTPENPIRFFDEAPAGPKNLTSRNIFFEFQNFEKNQTALYSVNEKKKALEFMVCASATITGFPDQRYYLKYHGDQMDSEDYQVWLDQTSRRFRLYIFHGPESFLMPYSRFFSGVDSYIRKGMGIVNAGIPGFQQ